jgi:hypothetical protein
MTSRIEAEGSIEEALWDILPETGHGDRYYLGEAQGELVEKIREGATCLCCGQFAKVYPRKLNANMVAFLISLYRHHRKTKDWVHHTDCFHVGRDYPYVATWGLARMKPNEGDSSKRESGLWKTTKKGRLFIREAEFVPSHVFMYNNHVVGWGARNIDVTDALGKKFNYRELMAGKVPK